jgi:hypothetical protein
MAHRARIIIYCQQDGTPGTYYYTLSTGWHTEHVLLYTDNRMAHRARIIIYCQQDGTPSTYYYILPTGWHTGHVLLYTANRMVHRARIIIHCQQNRTPSTYYYILPTGWHTGHVLLYTVNRMAHRACSPRRRPNTDLYSTGLWFYSQLRLCTPLRGYFEGFFGPSRNISGLYPPSIQDHFLKHHFQLFIFSHPITWCCVSLGLFRQINRMTN